MDLNSTESNMREIPGAGHKKMRYRTQQHFKMQDANRLWGAYHRIDFKFPYDIIWIAF